MKLCFYSVPVFTTGLVTVICLLPPLFWTFRVFEGYFPGMGFPVRTKGTGNTEQTFSQWGLVGTGNREQGTSHEMPRRTAGG